MKKILLLLSLLSAMVLTFNQSYAQYCGNSGPSICTPQSGLTTIGFYPADTGLPCVVDGQPYNQVVSFYAPASVQGYTLVDIQITSLTNLPCGLCWALNNSSNEILGNSTGCIRVQGTSNDRTGEYDMLIYAKVTVNVPIFGNITTASINIDSLEDLNYYARVKLPGDTCMQVDTNIVGNTASDSGSIIAPSISGNTTICAGDSTTLTATGASYYGYAWSNGTFNSSITVSAADTYSVTVYDNCNSASASASVVVSTVSTPTITPNGPTTFCQGGSVGLTSSAASTYHWSNGSTTQAISVSQASNYTITVTNANNCSAVSLPTTVVVDTNPVATITPGGPTTFCQGDSVTLSAPSGLKYAWSNTVTTQDITVLQSSSNKVTVTDGNNCSAVSLATAVVVNPNPDDTVTSNGPTTFCQGDSVILSAPSGLNYLWSNNATTQSITINQGGNLTVTVTNSNSCSAISAPIAVVVNANPVATVTPGGPTTFCPSDSVTLSAPSEVSYLWSNDSTTQNITATLAGNYSVTVTDSNNCTGASTPTTVALYAITQINSQPISESTCVGGNASFSVAASGNDLGYQWILNGQVTAVTDSLYSISSAAFSDTGNYVAVVTGTCGTDTSNAADLSLSTSVSILQQPNSQTTCTGTTVTFSVAANGSNTGFQWYKDGQMLTGSTESAFTINSVAITDSGTYTCAISSTCGDTVSAAAVLTVNAPTFDTLYDTICSNSSFDFNGQILTTGGSYNDTLTNSNDCDSIITLYLTVNATSASIISTFICAGETYNFNGQTISTAGTYYDTLTNVNGCDSIITLNLSVNPTSSTTINAGVCTGNSYDFNGTTLTASGIYYDTLQNVGGCDSVVTLNLQVDSSILTQLSQSICQGESFSFNGQSLTASGIYTDTLTALGGCDSVILLNLAVNPVNTLAIAAVICAGDSLDFNGVALTQTGSYTDTFSNSFGCDSIVTVNLVAIQPVFDTMNITVCNGSSYEFSGQLLTEAGTYADTTIGSNGCDSITVLNLQFTAVLITEQSASICQGSSYSFADSNLTSGGFYYDTLTAQGGCDSIIILNLSVNEPTSSSFSATICSGGTYSFNAQNLSVAGTYKDTLTGISGCDSVVTLTLTVNLPLTFSTSARICAGQVYPFGTLALMTEGTYQDTVTTLSGCDSIVTLTLTVDSLPNVTWNVSDTLCYTGGDLIVLPEGNPANGVYSGNGVSSGELNLEVAGSGPYPVTYTYTDSSGCSDSVTNTFVLDTCTGISEVSIESSIRLYPNPAGNVMIAESEYFTDGTIVPVIFDIQGNSVPINFTRQAGKFVFNTQSLPAGIYCLNLHIAGAVISKRFVKAE